MLNAVLCTAQKMYRAKSICPHLFDPGTLQQILCNKLIICYRKVLPLVYAYCVLYTCLKL